MTRVINQANYYCASIVILPLFVCFVLRVAFNTVYKWEILIMIWICTFYFNNIVEIFFFNNKFTFYLFIWYFFVLNYIIFTKIFYFFNI